MLELGRDYQFCLVKPILESMRFDMRNNTHSSTSQKLKLGNVLFEFHSFTFYKAGLWVYISTVVKTPPVYYSRTSPSTFFKVSPVLGSHPSFQISYFIQLYLKLSPIRIMLITSYITQLKTYLLDLPICLGRIEDYNMGVLVWHRYQWWCGWELGTAEQVFVPISKQVGSLPLSCFQQISTPPDSQYHSWAVIIPIFAKMFDWSQYLPFFQLKLCKSVICRKSAVLINNSAQQLSL